MSPRRSNHLVAFIFVLSAVAVLTAAQISKAQPMDPADRPAPRASMVAPAMSAPTPVATPMAVEPMAAAVPAPMAPPSPMAVAPMDPVMEPVVTAEPVQSEPDPVEHELRDLDVPVQTAPATPTKGEPTAPGKAPTTSAAKVEKADNWWQTLLGGVAQLVLLIVGGIAAPLGVLLVRLIAKKAKISDAEQQQAMEMLVSNAINLGINYATQMSNKLNNTPDAKSQRIKWATDKAAEIIKEYGIPEKSAKWIMDRIEAQLGLMNGTRAAAGDGFSELGADTNESKPSVVVIPSTTPFIPDQVVLGKVEEPKLPSPVEDSAEKAPAATDTTKPEA